MSDESGNGFFAELKRRNVFRAAAAYLVVAWLVIQIVDVVFPRLGISERVITLVIVVLGIGVVPVIVLAWVYELTPSGIKADEEVPDTRRRSGMRVFDYVVAVALTAIVVIYLAGQFQGSADFDEPSLATDPPSIAVLPFENRSANPEDVFFVDGIHDDILASLAKIGSIKVISRTSVERFKNPDRSLRDIGAELGVTSILEGGVQRSGDTVRINVQLIDVETDSHMWAEPFDRQLTAQNVFEIQSEIARTIAGKLHAVITEDEESRLTRIPTQNLEAYEAYLLGNQRIQRRTGVSLEEAVDYFEESIRLDPTFSLAWVGLADAYLLLPRYGDRSRDETLQPALDAVWRAIELDAQSGEAYATLGSIHLEFDTGTDSEEFFLKSIELNPNYAPGRQWYGEYLNAKGRNDEALAQLQIAVELDPLSPIVNSIIASVHVSRGELDQAKARILRSIEIDPQYARGFGGLASFYRDTGHWARGLTAMQEARRLNPAPIALVGLQAQYYLHMGDEKAALEIIAETEKLDPNSPFTRFARAMFYTFRLDAEAFQFALDHWQFDHIRGFTVPILVTSYLRRGDTSEALALFSTYDGYFSLPDFPDAPALRSPRSVLAAVLYARALLAADRKDEAEPWISALLIRARQNVAPAPGETNFDQIRLRALVQNAGIYALAGDKSAALVAMRQAVDAHWSAGWKYHFDHDPALDLIRQEAEFVKMRETVAARMADQLATYRSGEVNIFE